MFAIWAFVVAGSVVAVALAYALWRSRREIGRLRDRLEVAAMELEHLQRSFSRFAPNAVVESILAGGDQTAERREVTVLFADLVGSSTLSEQLPPEALVRILNGYFERMSRVIADHRGHVAKFIGDGILALFGALQRNPWQADDAAHTALAMRAALDEYNRELAQRGDPQLRMGIGIHGGTAIAGLFGSQELMEFTVVGRTVNLASRVEHLTRNLGGDVLVTAEVAKALDPRFQLQELPAVPVAGFNEPVATWRLVGFGDTPLKATGTQRDE